MSKRGYLKVVGLNAGYNEIHAGTGNEIKLCIGQACPAFKRKVKGKTGNEGRCIYEGRSETVYAQSSVCPKDTERL